MSLSAETQRERLPMFKEGDRKLVVRDRNERIAADTYQVTS
jgi:hypothetical protein